MAVLKYLTVLFFIMRLPNYDLFFMKTSVSFISQKNPLAVAQIKKSLIRLSLNAVCFLNAILNGPTSISSFPRIDSAIGKYVDSAGGAGFVLDVFFSGKMSSASRKQ